jgi:hypothetical protein
MKQTGSDDEEIEVSIQTLQISLIQVFILTNSFIITGSGGTDKQGQPGRRGKCSNTSLLLRVYLITNATSLTGSGGTEKQGRRGKRGKH